MPAAARVWLSSRGCADGPSCGATPFRYRQAKDGQWVKRWLELDGETLCSYKSSDKPRLLNAVNLKKVCNHHPMLFL